MVTVHHPDQLWWPDVGLRKQDAIDYYAAIAPVVLPHLRDRPLTLKRHFNGPRSPFEWIKDAPPELPEWIGTTHEPAKSRGGAPVRYAVVDSVEAPRLPSSGPAAGPPQRPMQRKASSLRGRSASTIWSRSNSSCSP